jgi:hypothetical protein
MRRALPAVGGLIVLAALVALPVVAAAQGCAMCKTTLEGSTDPLVGALNTSVLFMMAMPYAIVATIGSWIYFVSRRGSAAEVPTDGSEPSSELVKERCP